MNKECLTFEEYQKKNPGRFEKCPYIDFCTGKKCFLVRGEADVNTPDDYRQLEAIQRMAENN